MSEIVSKNWLTEERKVLDRLVARCLERQEQHNDAIRAWKEETDDKDGKLFVCTVAFNGWNIAFQVLLAELGAANKVLANHGMLRFALTYDEKHMPNGISLITISTESNPTQTNEKVN